MFMMAKKSIRSTQSTRPDARLWSELIRARVCLLHNGPLEYRWFLRSTSRRRGMVVGALLALASFGRALRAEDLARAQTTSPDSIVTFRLRHHGFDPARSAASSDGCRLLLRAQGGRFYEIDVNRRDNTTAIRKRSDGEFLLSAEVPHMPPYDEWQDVRATIEDRPDGSVNLDLFSSGALLVSVTDDGSVGGPPIHGNGLISVLAQNARVEIAAFTLAPVTSLAGATAPATPLINALEPSSIQAGGLAMDLAVDGAGFSPKALVRWNGQARPAFLQGDGRLIIRLSPHDIASPGSFPVEVANPGAQFSNAMAFKVAPGILKAEVTRP